MGSTFERVTKVLVTNTTAANTGNSVTTVADGDVILFNRQFNEVADTDTVQTSADASDLYVGLGVAGGGMTTSAKIQTRNIRLVKPKAYAAATQYSVTIGNITAVNNTEYIVKIIYRDYFPTTPGQSAPRSYSFISDASATAAEIATGLAGRINSDKNAMVTATVAADTLVITGKVIPVNAIDTYQRVSFDVATPYGFADTTTQTVNAGSEGSGTGQKVKNMEQATKNDQRILFPIPSDKTLASNTGKYNLVVIEHYNEHIGDAADQRKEPLKTIIAFSTVDGTPSAKQTAFMTKLTSVVESAGIYVS